MKKKRPKKEITPDPIKERLRSALESSDVTRAFLARRFGITIQAVSEWFNLKKSGKCEPHRYPDLADLLGVNLVWLLSGKGPREGVNMSEEEFSLLRKFQQLDSAQRETVSDLIDSMLRRQAPPPGSFAIGRRR